MVTADLPPGGSCARTSLLGNPAACGSAGLSASSAWTRRAGGGLGLRPRSPRARPPRSGLRGRRLQLGLRAGKAAAAAAGRLRWASGSRRRGCARLLPGPFPYGSAQAQPAAPSALSFPASFSPFLAPAGAGPQAPPPRGEAAGLSPRRRGRADRSPFAGSCGRGSRPPGRRPLGRRLRWAPGTLCPRDPGPRTRTAAPRPAPPRPHRRRPARPS